MVAVNTAVVQVAFLKRIRTPPGPEANSSLRPVLFVQTFDQRFEKKRKVKESFGASKGWLCQRLSDLRR
jgi:hypothetical protein